MTETFLLLLAGGLAAATGWSHLPNRGSATWRWTAVLAMLACVGCLIVYFARGPVMPMKPLLRRIQTGLVLATVIAVAAHLLLPDRWPRRALATAAFVLCVLAGSNVLHEQMFARGTALHLPPKMLSMAAQTLVCAGVAATIGFAMANVLFVGEPAATPTSWDRWTLTVIASRAVIGVVGLAAAQTYRPADQLWQRHGFSIAVRFFALLMAGVTLYRNCSSVPGDRDGQFQFNRRVAASLALFAEASALDMTIKTGLPF